MISRRIYYRFDVNLFIHSKFYSLKYSVFVRDRWITPKTQRLAHFCLLISCRCWILAQIWMMILTKYSNYLKKNVIAPCYIICVFINKIQHYVEFYIIGRNLNLKNGFKKLPRGKINLCFHLWRNTKANKLNRIMSFYIAYEIIC